MRMKMLPSVLLLLLGLAVGTSYAEAYAYGNPLQSLPAQSDRRQGLQRPGQRPYLQTNLRPGQQQQGRSPGSGLGSAGSSLNSRSPSYSPQYYKYDSRSPSLSPQYPVSGSKFTPSTIARPPPRTPGAGATAGATAGAGAGSRNRTPPCDCDCYKHGSKPVCALDSKTKEQETFLNECHVECSNCTSKAHFKIVSRRACDEK